MSSEKRRTGSDSSDAYARAVRREEQQQEREQQQHPHNDKIEKNAEITEIDEASDLFRQHSHQQSMEGG
ncbi:hypothetical protein MITS9509_01938 [Synechococcus sp. MIT S9509]|uniref:hypothetical protein n=1 Tax=unclassified Synechococcus TaxID=2626047 RepID=UPI0007BB1540|nr:MULTISPECIES: hypothetical protein [unclassified Synechococcus]KZR85954.1 hypothetical protein MITS9504_01737 [Synechococcus sp. MIT S9504]KZR92017.1 hypothetical protein MITS9509_01938 [Synechococcus sp. MIT S9509]